MCLLALPPIGNYWSRETQKVMTSEFMWKGVIGNICDKYTEFIKIIKTMVSYIGFPENDFLFYFLSVEGDYMTSNIQYPSDSF